METESAQVKFLIGLAFILAAFIIVYNVFYIPDAVPFSQISTDGGTLSNPAVFSEGSSEEESPAEKVSINKATAEELDSLPGIGPALAQAILSYREETGGFSSLEELMEVPGIGEKVFAGLQDQIVLD